MIYFIRLILVSFIILTSTIFSQDIKELKLDLKKSSELTFKNLRLYPILAENKFIEKNSKTGNYLNLKEALEQGKVKITEKTRQRDSNEINIIDGSMINRPNREVEARINPPIRQDSGNINQQVQVQSYDYSTTGQVNTLVIENLSQDTVYLMAGDVVKGGKQDRIVGKDMLILPGSKDIDLGVFCVEKGRWHVTGDSSNEFKGYFNVVSNSIRGSVQKEANQSKVWSKVDEITAQNKAGSTTSTYTALEKSEEFTKANDEYIKFFENKFDDSKGVVGFVAVTGDSVLGTDIFCNPELFRKQYKFLIHSYITDAISFGKEVKINNEKVIEFMNKAFQKFEQKLPDESETKLKFKNKDDQLIHFYMQ
ncbi:MAG: hypothetical protein EPN82_01625 [Bacteroidetes bacterium]|nr:MAG: hypothetical protein EPN82_01625 [Bacteroidota bacterium]